MTTCPGKSCSFGLLLSVYVFSYFPFSFEERIWYLIVSVPDHCLPFYLTYTDNVSKRGRGSDKQ